MYADDGIIDAINRYSFQRWINQMEERRDSDDTHLWHFQHEYGIKLIFMFNRICSINQCEFNNAALCCASMPSPDGTEEHLLTASDSERRSTNDSSHVPSGSTVAPRW